MATRASALARAQSGWVGDRIAEATGARIREVLVTTRGDTSTAALTSFGGQGVFVTAVRQAVLDGRADVAVHSMKDMPTASDPDTTIVAVPAREDVRDFVVAAVGSLEDLPDGARVGTGSPRRAAFLRRARPDLRVVDIRGNVDSRVEKVERGGLDAVVVAVSGLRRLGISPPGFPLGTRSMLPAVGQGALAVQMRAGDPLAASIATVDHAMTRACVVAERQLLASLRAGCAAPVGALCRVVDSALELRAAVLSADGSTMYDCLTTGPVDDPVSVGRRAAEDLIGLGADRLLGDD